MSRRNDLRLHMRGLRSLVLNCDRDMVSDASGATYWRLA
jgi:hypothetical protein